MLKSERADQIIEILREQKYTTVATLVDRLHYSPATIRRDLVYLEGLGLVKKSYGGVSFRAGAPLIVREHEYTVEKVRLCHAAEEFVQDGYTVFVDGTTTTYHLGEVLVRKKNVTVVTNNLKLAMYLNEHGVRCFVTGGEVLDTAFLGGTYVADMLEKMRFDVAFYSVGVAGADGRLNVSSAFTEFMRVVLARSEKNVCLFLKSKWRERCPMAFQTVGVFDVVISDVKMPADFAARFPDTKFLQIEGTGVQAKGD